jgi:hypothetical protein
MVEEGSEYHAAPATYLFHIPRRQKEKLWGHGVVNRLADDSCEEFRATRNCRYGIFRYCGPSVRRGQRGNARAEAAAALVPAVIVVFTEYFCPDMHHVRPSYSDEPSGVP